MPTSQSLDGVQPRPALSRQTPQTMGDRVQLQGAGKLQQAPAVKRVQFSPPVQPRPGFWERFQLPLIVGAGIIAGYLVQALWFGIIAIIIYGILSLILRIDSRVTFALAFISLLTVPVLLLFKANSELASNFATYTFLLLVIGVIALSFEARPTSRKRKRRHGR